MTPIGWHRQKDQPLVASNPFGALSLRLVPMVTNGTNGKFYNGTIEKTPNATTMYKIFSSILNKRLYAWAKKMRNLMSHKPGSEQATLLLITYFL